MSQEYDLIYNSKNTILLTGCDNEECCNLLADKKELEEKGYKVYLNILIKKEE